jgi:hypothetical protein
MGLPDYSGILGLGFSGGTMAKNTTNNATAHYTSLLANLFATPAFSSKASQRFSLALSRDESNSGTGGLLTIGSLPSLTDPAVNVSSTKLSSAAIQHFYNVSTTQYSFYSILIDGFEFGGQFHSPNTSTIVDSGYNGLEIPAETATLLNQKWSPPGNMSGSTLYLDCGATLSQPFGIRIGGQTYYIQSADLVGQMMNGTCYSLIIPGLSPNGYSLGDPLLKNTLTVFNWGNMTLDFYPRMHYAS